MIRKLTTLKAIRLKCIDCCAGNKNEVKLCTCTQCPLYEYRFGHIPSQMPTYDDGVEVTDELRQRWKESGERMRKLREQKLQEKASDDSAEEDDFEEDDSDDSDEETDR